MRKMTPKDKTRFYSIVKKLEDEKDQVFVVMLVAQFDEGILEHQGFVDFAQRHSTMVTGHSDKDEALRQECLPEFMLNKGGV